MNGDETMLDAWRRLESEVLDPTAGPVQHGEMRLAFFSGRFALLGLRDPSSPAKLHARCRELYEELADLIKAEGRRLEEQPQRSSTVKP